MNTATSKSGKWRPDMEILIGWIVLAGVVAIIAAARGRNAIGWLLLAIITSPLIACIIVLALPNLHQQELLRKITDKPIPGDRAPFEPDGVYAGFPYRVAADGSIEAVMQGAKVRFQNFDKFTGAIGTS